MAVNEFACVYSHMLYYYIRGEGEAFNDSSASRNHSDLICREETSFLCDSVRCCFHLISTQLNFFFSLCVRLLVHKVFFLNL